jgi:hypothetical protein
MTIGSWFGTEYDEPAAPAALPATLDSGMDPSIAILDQAVRGHGIVGRVLGEFGAVAIKVRGTGRPVRVHLEIGLDDTSTRWWGDRVSPSRSTTELPRLVTVRAQGVIRGAVLLARQQGWRRAGSATATLRFDLAGDDVTADGLIIVEVAEAPQPSWAAGHLSPQSAIGLRINSVCLAALSDSEPVSPASGPSGFTGCAFAVVQPGTASAWRIETAGIHAAPPVPRTPTNRYTRQKPSRAVFKVGRAVRRVAVTATHRPGSPATDVLATDLLTGEPVPAEVTRHGETLEVRLAAPAGAPVLLGSADPSPTVSWRITPLAAT